MSYKNYRWKIIANDSNSPFIRNYIWGSAFLLYPRLFRLPRVILATFNHNNIINYFILLIFLLGSNAMRD
ncbi:MAG: hypothetical protein AB1465_05720 [Patescibacteria group bacterium]